MKKSFLLLILGFLISCNNDHEILSDIEQLNVANSHFVSLEYAKAVAVVNDGFYVPHGDELVTRSTEIREIKASQTLFGSDGLPAYYIINLVGGGFRIVPADNRLEPILAHSETGELTEEAINECPGLALWINNMILYIENIKDTDQEQSEITKALWKDVNPINPLSNIPSDPECSYEGQTIYEINTFGPLITSDWHQGADYNSALDDIGCAENNGKPLLGCPTIAAGIVMRYLQRPQYLEWDKMPLNEATSTTAIFFKDLAAKLIGLNNLGCNQSGTTIDKVCSVLKNDYGFSSAKIVNHTTEVVHEQMVNNSPVIMRGDDGVSGHEWVVSGTRYMNNYQCVKTPYNTLVKQFILRNSIKDYFVDWGWFGTADAWYSVAGFQYPNNMRMIVNLK